MRYSVTGTSRTLDAREKALVYAIVAALEDVDEFTSGCAYGVDTAAHQAAVHTHPSALKRLCVPAAPHNASLVKTAELPSINWAVEYVGVPPGSHRGISAAYMARNDRLVSHADTLIAFPAIATEQLRSGTWATIRRARKAGVPVRIYPLTLAHEGVAA
jgi:predicted Rossmann fold nucleotide-binding protein DprA/Smf involved in DNA uptake